jgi:hypothetical protein
VNAEELAVWLEQRLPSELDLDAATTRVTHILNWGGFVNHSFFVRDGHTRYHLKLTPFHDGARLRQWYELGAILAARYRAPAVLRWIEFPEIALAGLLLEHLDATPVTLACNPALLRDVIELMQRLHGDTNLLSRLHTTAGRTCLDHFVETYIGRFALDLEGIGAAELPFLSTSLTDWMHSETLALREFAESRLVFREPAVSPVHSDLNQTNVLATPSGWRLIDWDDLATGDPAIDFAVLLWPLVWAGHDWRKFVPRDEALRQRLEVCFRAQLLDEVIDPLSDYIDAHAAPSRMEEVRRVKRQRHEDALARYRAANS